MYFCDYMYSFILGLYLGGGLLGHMIGVDFTF